MTGDGATLQGGPELERRLKRLGNKVSGKVLRKALRAGARPIWLAARRGAARGSSDKPSGKMLWRGIKILSGRRRRFGMEVIVASTAPHSHLVEIGTGPRYQKKSGKWVGIMPFQPFMRPAFHANRRRAEMEIGRVLRVEIEKVCLVK